MRRFLVTFRDEAVVIWQAPLIEEAGSSSLHGIIAKAIRQI
jgi:hypothetical protein